jgi:capsid protein
MAVRWQGRRWAEADPVKAVTADKDEIALGINSRQNVCRSRGRDFSVIVEELARENAIAKQLQIDISGATVTIKEPEPGNDAENDEEAEGDDAADSKATPSPTRRLQRVPA